MGDNCHFESRITCRNNDVRLKRHYSNQLSKASYDNCGYTIHINLHVRGSANQFRRDPTEKN